MDFPPSFRVHIADPLGYAEAPFIITTAFIDAKGCPRAEWFLVIPEEKGLLIAQRNKIDCTAFPENCIELGEELLLEGALDQAKLRLRRHILEHKGRIAPLLLAAHTQVQSSDHKHLAKFWMRGSYCGFLSEIRAKSECVPLIDTLVWIHGLPMLATTDL